MNRYAGWLYKNSKILLIPFIFLFFSASCSSSGEYNLLYFQYSKISSELETAKKELNAVTADLDKTNAEIEASRKQVSFATPKELREFKSYDELDAWIKKHIKKIPGDRGSLTAVRETQKEAYQDGFVVSICNNALTPEIKNSYYASQQSRSGSFGSREEDVPPELVFPTTTAATNRYYNLALVGYYIYWWYPEDGKLELLAGFISFPK